MEIKGLVLIGEGERSKVYQHPTEAGKVIKVTKHSSEKKVLKYFHKNPNPIFVHVYEVEIVGQTIFATCEKVEAVDFRFTDKNGYPWWYSKFNETGYSIKQGLTRALENLDAPEVDVRAYFDYLQNCNNIGLCVYDSAWNTGKRTDGTFVCFDSQF